MKNRLLSPSKVVKHVRAAISTTVFILEVLPMLPSRPIDWLTKTPRVERVRYPSLSGEIEGDLYLPGGDGPHAGIVVCLGVVPFGVDHPQVPRLGRALARSGFAALLYWSPAMRDLRLDPDDTHGIAQAFRWLIDQPYIDEARSGLLGTCVGGSFALMAAAQPTIRDRVAFVVAWAPYSSMRTLARDIASATTASDGSSTPWQVDQLTRKVYVRSLTSTLEPDEAEQIRTLCADRDARNAPEEMSPDGRAVFPLLTALDRNEAIHFVDQLPSALLARLDEMSPLTHIKNLRAPLVILAHDRDDAVIPIGESHHLVAALAGREGIRYTEFKMFKHLDPTKVKLPPVALCRELAKFVGSVYPIFENTTGPANH